MPVNKESNFQKRNGVPRKNLSVKAQLRKAKTVDDLFAQDDVNQVITEIIEQKPNIKGMVVLYFDTEDTLNYRITDGMQFHDAIYALDRVKYLLHSED